mgnify:FL=1
MDILNWIISLLFYALLFYVLNKQQKEKGVNLLQKILVVILFFHINAIGSLILYEPMMNLFQISTNGFMNLNGLITLAIIWMILSIVILIVSYYTKNRLGTLYNTIKRTQIVFLILPTFLLMLFLFAVSLK